VGYKVGFGKKERAANGRVYRLFCGSPCWTRTSSRGPRAGCFELPLKRLPKTPALGLLCLAESRTAGARFATVNSRDAAICADLLIRDNQKSIQKRPPKL